MARVRTSWGHLEIKDEDVRDMLRGSDVAGAVESVAERMASRARSSAPGEPGGEYAGSIHVEVDSTKTRARARVIADAPHATVVESRTGNLRRAMG